MPLKLKKYDGITALDAAHPLYSKVDRFILFDTTIKDLKAGQVYTSSAATIADDVPLGANIRQFDATADAISPNVPIPFPCTIMFIYRQYGSNSLGGGDTSMIRLSSGDMLILDAGNWGGYDYRLTRRGNFGTVHTTDFKAYRDGLDWSTQQAAVTARRQQAHCTAIDYISGASGFCADGITRTPAGGTTAPVFTPAANPISAQLAAIVSSGKEWNLAGFVVFNTVLSTAEKESITQEPWELTNGYEALEASISAALTPGATITATLLNYPSLPTSVTVVDSRGNDLVLPLTATSATTATFTVPALASSTTGQEYVQYGAVNLTFGAKTISSTFAPVSPVEYVTMIAPVATNAFESWGPDVPVAGEQLSSQGNFDINGNFTGADPEAVYTCWITRLNGANHRFTVQQGSAEPPETVAAPSMSPAAGSYVNNVTITITTNTDGATTRYTTDGSDVTTSSILYSVPFTLTSSATVKARSFKAGLADSTQTTQTYVLTSAPVSGIATMSPWQSTLTHALRINQIIDATGINVTKLAVTQEDYVDILTVNQIIVALNLTGSIPLLGVNQPAYATALTINAIIQAIS